MFTILNVAPEGQVSVLDLIEWGAEEKLEAISTVSTTASKEFSLRNALVKVRGRAWG